MVAHLFPSVAEHPFVGVVTWVGSFNFRCQCLVVNRTSERVTQRCTHRELAISEVRAERTVAKGCAIAKYNLVVRVVNKGVTAIALDENFVARDGVDACRRNHFQSRKRLSFFINGQRSQASLGLIFLVLLAQGVAYLLYLVLVIGIIETKRPLPVFVLDGYYACLKL